MVIADPPHFTTPQKVSNCRQYSFIAKIELINIRSRPTKFWCWGKGGKGILPLTLWWYVEDGDDLVHASMYWSGEDEGYIPILPGSILDQRSNC